MLNAYFGNGTVELLSEFNTRFSPSSPASRTFKVRLLPKSTDRKFFVRWVCNSHSVITYAR